MNWWEWWKRLSHVAKVAGAVGAITGAIVGIAAAWPIIEFMAPAHRGYVVEQIGGVRTTTNELLIWKFEDTRDRKKSEASSWNIQVQKETDQNQRALIQQRIEQLTNEQKVLDERIQRLRQ